MKILDDFLAEDEFDHIQSYFQKSLPWHYLDHIVGNHQEDPNCFQFVHTFSKVIDPYLQFPHSKHSHIIKPILSKLAPWIEANLDQFPLLHRWDVLGTFINTPLQTQAMEIWAEAIRKGDNLACKWSPRRSAKAKTAGVKTALRKALGMSNGDMRRHISANTNVIETPMCNGGLEDWPIANTPGVALARNTNALMNKVPDNYIAALTGGKLNTDVLYPHELWRLANSGSRLNLSTAVNTLFNALPDYVKSGERIMCMPDVSGSMNAAAGSASSSLSCMDVGLALSLYLSDRLEGPLHRKMIAFSGEPSMMDWNNLGTAYDCMQGTVKQEIAANGDTVNTDLCKAIKTTVDFAKVNGLPKDRMPTCLMIFSDMQFDEMKHFYGFSDGRGYYGGSRMSDRDTLSSIEASLQYWEDNGFNRPAVVFWNLRPCEGNPAPDTWGDIAYVSGFSPAVMEEVLANFEVVIQEDGSKKIKLDPEAVMESTLRKFPVKTPYVIL